MTTTKNSSWEQTHHLSVQLNQLATDLDWQGKIEKKNEWMKTVKLECENVDYMRCTFKIHCSLNVYLCASDWTKQMTIGYTEVIFLLLPIVIVIVKFFFWFGCKKREGIQC